MNADDPNIPLLDSVAQALGPLCQRFVFVGGCAAGLLVTDSAAPPARVTRDVDVIVEVLSLFEYQVLEKDLEGNGFKHDRRSDAPVCRWIVGGCILDVVPTDERILGFSNRWYGEAVRTASPFELPSGLQIRLISPPTFLATKLEAFAGRGGGDYRASHDLEDIVSLVNGRVELPDEVGSAAAGLRSYLANRSGALLAEPKFIDALPGHLPGDETSQARMPMIIDRLKRISLLS
jgi:hypothetical protein